MRAGNTGSTNSSNRSKKGRILNARVAWPADHGSWVFLLSPLLIGLFAGGRWTEPSAYLIVAAMSGFLVRQPVTVAVKALSGRRSQRDLPAAFFWTAVYGGIGLLHVAGLAMRGFGYILYLAIPGMSVFIWYLWLVSRREERKQMGMELLATGVLALTAPAGLWAGLGRPDPMGWLLWVMTWAQSAASVVYVYLRLKQRALEEVPPVAERLKLGRSSLIFAGCNMLAVGALGAFGVVSQWLFVPYALQLAACVRGALQPARGWKPVAIGMRQLLVSTLFTILFILAWRL